MGGAHSESLTAKIEKCLLCQIPPKQEITRQQSEIEESFSSISLTSTNESSNSYEYYTHSSSTQKYNTKKYKKKHKKNKYKHNKHKRKHSKNKKYKKYKKKNNKILMQTSQPIFYLKRSTDDMELILKDNYNTDKYDNLMPTFGLTPKLKKDDSITLPNTISPTLTRHNRSKSMPNLHINQYANPFTHNYAGNNQHHTNINTHNSHHLSSVHALNNTRVSNIIANMKLTPMDYKLQQIKNKQNRNRINTNTLQVLKNRKLVAVREQNSVEIFKDNESLDTNSSFEGNTIPMSLDKMRMAISDSQYIVNKTNNVNNRNNGHKKQVSWKDLNSLNLENINSNNSTKQVRSRSVDG